MPISYQQIYTYENEIKGSKENHLRKITTNTEIFFF